MSRKKFFYKNFLGIFGCFGVLLGDNHIKVGFEGELSIEEVIAEHICLPLQDTRVFVVFMPAFAGDFWRWRLA